MSHTVDIASDAVAPVGSERMRLARLARARALLVPGVVDTSSGPGGMFVTAGGGDRIDGVVCAATSGGSYEVSLRLVCEMVPLLALAEQVRDSVTRAAAHAGISLQDVSVHIAGLAHPGAR